MREIFYASVVESLMYAMLCTRPDICFMLAWLADTSQTWQRTLDSGKVYIQVSSENERLYASLPG